MKTTITPTLEIVRQVVRGEQPLASLESIGVHFHIEKTPDGVRSWIDTAGKLVTTVGLNDLALGLLAHADDQAALREWALFINAAEIDFDADQHPLGETLLEALHDASFGARLEPLTLKKLQQLAMIDRGSS